MIGSNIQEIRKKRGFSLSDLAERANISKSYLSNIERNLNKNPSIYIILKLADVLEVDLRELLMLEFQGGNKEYFEKERLTFIKELKELGLEKEQIKEYKTLIEFLRWKNEQIGAKG